MRSVKYFTSPYLLLMRNNYNDLKDTYFQEMAICQLIAEILQRFPSIDTQ